MSTNGGLDQYKLTDEDTHFLERLGFQLIAMDVNLEAIDLRLPAIAALKDQRCVYFWRMRHDGNEYKIYVGKTSSLPRRLREYRNEFQPGVPNDFKLRHFQSWARNRFPGSALDLYAVQTNDDQAVETEVWRKTKPVINERADVSSHNLKNSHAEYYRTIFEHKLTPIVTQSSHSVPSTPPNRPTTLHSEAPSLISNHEMIAKAMRTHAGKTLETSDIRKIILSTYPDFNVGSCLPNDHAVGNKSCCPCAGTDNRIFDRVGRSQYHVR